VTLPPLDWSPTGNPRIQEIKEKENHLKGGERQPENKSRDKGKGCILH
jgi:hypothetical protein